MAILVQWDNKQKTIIRHTYKGDWTLDEYIDASKQTYAMIDELDTIVHLLIIVTEGVRPISDMIIAARDDRTVRHDRQGLVVVIGASSLMILITRVISAVRPAARNVKFVSTEDEAYHAFDHASANNGKSR